MATTKTKKKARGPTRAARRTTNAKPRRPKRAAPAVEAVRGATRRDVGGIRLETGRAGNARVKRAIYPPGFRWSVDMKPLVGTELCMHAHVGFLSSGAIRIEYPDGCAVDFVAPQVVEIVPGHDGAVIGSSPAVLIELDFEGATVARLGLPTEHRHG